MSGDTTSIHARTSWTFASGGSAGSSAPRLQSRRCGMAAIGWLRRNSVEAAWFAFAGANLAAMVLWPSWETIPFHFIWISLTLVYGFRVWEPGATGIVLGLVIA